MFLIIYDFNPLFGKCQSCKFKTIFCACRWSDWVGITTLEHGNESKAQEFIYANQRYQWRCPSEQAVLNQLYELYQCGGVMPYTMEDFNRDFTEAHLHLLPPETIFRQFSAEERLKGLPLEERLKGLSIEEIRAYLAKLQD